MELLQNKAYHITVRGEISQISPVNGKDFQLEEVQNKVEGYIEIVSLSERQIMIVNEEGKFNKDYNSIATVIANTHRALGPGDYICGDVVICPQEMLR